MEMKYPYQLPPLPYAYGALAPDIGERTLCFYHARFYRFVTPSFTVYRSSAHPGRRGGKAT